MARRKNSSDQVTSVRGHSVEDLYKIMNEGRPYPEGVCRNFELNPPFFDCDDLESMTRPEAVSGGAVVVKSFENARPDVAEVTQAPASEPRAEREADAE